MTREQWLAERRMGVGGSDCASMFNVGYGCRRRLFYDKRDTPKDYEREQTKAMELGNVLEPWFAEQYALATGREVDVIEESVVHPSVPEMRVNVDRAVLDNGRDKAGVLEIKSVGRAVFYKIKREGLPEDYILQLQHGIECLKTTWGSFAIGSRDSGDLLWWDVEKDSDICNLIVSEVPRFWALVENGPAPEALDPEDKRCQRCEWRRTCHGPSFVQVDTGDIESDESLRPLLSEYDERASLYAQAEELLEETKEQLKTTLGERQAVLVGHRKIYYRPQAGRTTYKGKELLEAYRKAGLPDPDKFVSTGTPFKTLRIY